MLIVSDTASPNIYFPYSENPVTYAENDLILRNFIFCEKVKSGQVLDKLMLRLTPNG